MTLGRFKRLIAAYGARPERWPPGERAAALALQRTSEDARRLVAAEAKLDRLLDAHAFDGRFHCSAAAPASWAPKRLPVLFPAPIFAPMRAVIVGGISACAVALTLTWLDPLNTAPDGTDDILVAVNIDELEMED